MTLKTRGADLDVTIVNPNTQKGRNLIRAFRNSTKGDSIYKAYGKPSAKKVYAFETIKQEMAAVQGYGIRITGAGSDFFSCAYKLIDPEGKTYLIYHTHVNRFAILMED